MRPGRTFEILISEIEQHLAGENVLVTSPDYLPDKDTGVLREVDVAIRSTIGSISFLAIIECRDRSEKQDVRWIEELISKKTSVEVDAVIGVSSSEFTEPAKTKAQKNNIQLRNLYEVEAAEIADFIKNIVLVTNRVKTQDIRISLNYALEAGDENLEFIVPTRPESGVIMINTEDRKPVTGNDLVNFYITQGFLGDIFKKSSGRHTFNDLPYLPLENKYVVNTSRGERRVNGIRIEKIRLVVESIQTTVTEAYKYTDHKIEYATVYKGSGTFSDGEEVTIEMFSKPSAHLSSK